MEGPETYIFPIFSLFREGGPKWGLYQANRVASLGIISQYSCWLSVTDGVLHNRACCPANAIPTTRTSCCCNTSVTTSVQASQTDLDVGETSPASLAIFVSDSSVVGFANRCTPRVVMQPHASFRRVLRRFSNSKCFLEGFLEGACKGFQ